MMRNGTGMSENEKGDILKVKSGYISCVGRPNVGKSTLINKLIGTKIAAVSPKPQTTRRNIMGIKFEKDLQAQLVFIDTPGIHKPKNELGEEMVRQAVESIKYADIVYHLIDSSEGIVGEDIDVAENLKSIIKENKLDATVFCILTKIDLIKKENLLPIMEEVGKWDLYDEVIPVSALKDIGLDDLIGTTIKYLKEEEIVEGIASSLQPFKLIAQEIIMEKIYNQTHMEIPYCTAVDIEEIAERENGVLYIKATIYVEKPNQRKIVIGKDGAKIKQIGTLAREELELITRKKVFLDLWVKVKEDWRKNIHFVKKIYFLK